MKTKNVLWKRYRRTAEKVILIVKENKLDFDIEWLREAMEWIEKNQFVTDPLKRAIDNVLPAVKNMVRYRKLLARRKHGN